jgi:hypothetical protein
MNEGNENEQDLKLELQWVKYRLEILDAIEERLLEMRQLIEQAKRANYSELEIQEMYTKFHLLEEQVRILDEESRKSVRLEYL